MEGSTITFKRSHFYAALLPLAFVTGIAAGYLFWGRDSVAVLPANPPTTQSSESSSAQTTDSQTKATRYDVPIDDDPSLGPADAPITLIEFSDYECPFCRKWHTEVFPRLLEAYPNQIRYVYRDFPIASIHSNAVSAAEAANCAGDQGKYWEFSEKLFAMEYSLGQEAYTSYSQSLNLDQSKFDECISSRRHQAEVQADFDYAANLGISSTPTFFINGLALIGAQSFEVFQQVIDQELAGEIP